MKRLLTNRRNRTRKSFADPMTSDVESAGILNEAVNFNLQCIFIAIPKTGTTSVRSQLSQPADALVRNPHLDINQVRDLLYPFLLRASLGKNHSYPNEGVTTDKDIRNRADQIFSSFFKFSAVRNPWARAVSLYSRREGVQMKKELTFEAFCENHLYASDTCRHPTLHKNQFDWLCDEKDQLILDFVYKVEEFESAIEKIAEATEGRIKLRHKKANSNPNSKSSDYKEMYNDKTRKLIARNFEKDIDYFKYTF